MNQLLDSGYNNNKINYNNYCHNFATRKIIHAGVIAYCCLIIYLSFGSV